MKRLWFLLLFLSLSFGLKAENSFRTEWNIIVECTTPANLTATINENGLTLSWTGSDDAEYYEVFARNGYGESYHLVATTTDTYIEKVDYCPEAENSYYVVSYCFDGSENTSEVVSIGLEAVDFSVVDCHGTPFHLFEVLDRGQFVFIDFFKYSCFSCREIMPYMVESYYRYGCNNGDVYYLEISDQDSDEMCQFWSDEFGVEYPTVGVEGGGRKFADLYCLLASPHYLLIAPDHSIVMDGGFSGYYIHDLQSIIDVFEPLGIEAQQCEVGVDEKCDNQGELFPNPADGFVNIGAHGMIRVYNSLGQLIDSFIADNQQRRVVTENYPDGLYFVQVDGRQFGRFVVRH